MGRPKLLLPWRTSTVLGHLIESWQIQRADQIAVIHAADAQPLIAELDALGFPFENRIVNPDPDRGMFSSIQCASQWQGWKSELTHWVITLGDQPHLQSQTLRALLEFGARNLEKICQPIWNGRYRHPILFPKRFFVELKDSPKSNLKEFLLERVESLAGFESQDAGLALDMDTPADYERLRKEH
jgi:molybdenum cofactor cytidylyltransferase